VKGGVQRAFLDAKHVVRGTFDPSRDGVAVGAPPAHGLEDEEVERATENFDAGVSHVPIEFLCKAIMGKLP
jgi:hypothetical protein